MKRFVIIFISLIVGYALYWCISDYNYRYNKINSIVGIYKLDFNHTDSEIYKDSIEKYNNLRLIFNSDMTFSLSFSVPFMADTVGTWKVGGMDEWNEIVYHNGIIDQLGMIGPINGEISIAPIITAVELTFRPSEAIKMANIRIHKLAPLNSTPLRMESTVASSLSLSLRKSRYSFRKFLTANTFRLGLTGCSIKIILFSDKTIDNRYLTKRQIALYNIGYKQA